MDLQSTLEGYALQLKNVPRTLVAVARVVQKMMKVLYDTHCPDAENCRPGPNPECPDSDILTIGWLLEYITEDSENAGYRRLKSELKTVFPSLPERSRFNRSRRNLSGASEVLRRALADFLPPTEVFIVDSFPIPICDFKRATSSKSDLKWETDVKHYSTPPHPPVERLIGKHPVYVSTYVDAYGEKMRSKQRIAASAGAAVGCDIIVGWTYVF